MAKSARKGRKKVCNLREQVDPVAVRMWATPNAADSQGTTGGGQGRSLRSDVRMWPTPIVPNGGRSVKSVTDWKSDRTAYKGGRKVQVDLNAAVKMFPTPRAREVGDYQYSRGDHEKPALTLTGAAKLLPTPRAQCANGTGPSRVGNKADLQTIVGESEEGGQLNPAWVSRLMGFPDGWLALDQDDDLTNDLWIAHPIEAWESDWDSIPRVAAGVKDRVDKLKALGNAVVPQQFYPIFNAISEIEGANYDA